jgi:hypothetical protein
LHAPAPVRQIDAQPGLNPADSGTSASNQETKGKGKAGKTDPGVASSNTATESLSGANDDVEIGAQVTKEATSKLGVSLNDAAPTRYNLRRSSRGK